MSPWPPLAVAVALAISSASLAADPRPGGQSPAAAPAAVGSAGHLNLGLLPQVADAKASAAVPGADAADAGPDGVAQPENVAQDHYLDLHFGRLAQAGRGPGDVPPVYGEVGIDLDPGARLSIVPSYRVVVDQSDRQDRSAIDDQVVKLGARLRF
jgi:hypothetical protein